MDIRNIKIQDFNYHLPDERIAKHPLQVRDACKLLVYHNSAPENILTCQFSDIPSLLPHNSMLVYNNTRVINARLRFRKPDTGAVIEIFCLEPDIPRDYAQSFQSTSECTWTCLVGNAKRWKASSLQMQIPLPDGNIANLTATRSIQTTSSFQIHFSWVTESEEPVTFATLLELAGEIPIPPYLNRNTEECDSSDYQTVFSHIDGSVAAPTAGLHFTPEVLNKIDDKGIKRRELTLHVGAGTFQPVKSETIGDHPMHSEFISVERELLCDLIEQIQANNPIIAVGTTSVRTLESLYYIGLTLHNDINAKNLIVPQWKPYESTGGIGAVDALKTIVTYLDNHNMSRYVGSTQIMIAPGYNFRIINGMITNFHQPQSTLLLLVSAFTKGNWRSIYDYALNNNYRFLSYGDASLLLE